MGYRLSYNEVDKLFEELQKEYDIYAPKRLPKQGRYSDTDIIKYQKITHVDEIEYKEKSTYPMKEVVAPIEQTLFYFTEDEYREPSITKKQILVFARACDINVYWILRR